VQKQEIKGARNEALGNLLELTNGKEPKNNTQAEEMDN
jgi:hypothetical protein